MKNRLLYGLLACATFTVTAGAQNNGGGLPPRLTPLLEQWQGQHGSNWRIRQSPGGYAEMIYGGGAAATLVPRNDADFAFVARQFVEQSAAMHGISSAELVEQHVRLIGMGQVNSTDKMAVRFRQEVGGVPVEGALVNTLLAMDGTLLALHSTAIPNISGADPRPRISVDQAARAASEAFADEFGVVTSVGEASLIFARADVGEEASARLAWQLDVRQDIADAVPAVQRYSIDAANGSVLKRENQVHHFDVTGTVVSNATPGTAPDGAGNPPVQVPMAYMTVTSSAGTTTTDVNGEFNYPGVNTALDVTVSYDGTFDTVNNDTGADYSLTTSVPANNPTNVVMNPAPTQQITAQANAFRHQSTVRDWIRSVDPGDSSADFQAVSNVNLSSTCNAFFDGVSTNYYLAGGGCPNSAYSTVVAHEVGHWLNVIYSTGNGSDGIGEGNADVWAMYIFDTPIIAEDFFGPGVPIRTGLNTRPYCGDGNNGCHGGVHNNGEVWMGAAWKIRENLNTTHGNAVGDMIADTIFLSWMNVYNQTTIDSIMEIQWLTLDDDDADINNGTPNYNDIDDGFVAQSFPGFELPSVVYSNVTQLPTTTDEAGPYTVNADIVANINPPLQNPTLRYRVNGGGFQDVAMSPVSGDTYTADILGQVSPAEVEYYLTAENNGGNSNDFPADAPATTLSFQVGVLTTIFETDFEPAGDEGWTVGDAGDAATTGVWERDDPRGTAAQTEDDHTVAGDTCWFTGQGSPSGSLGENDVDGGRTTLKSPVFDAAGLENPKVSYWRWYSNNTGADPNNDIFEVDISDDGGSSWTSVEVVGPGGSQSNGGWFQHSFAISDIVTPTANMQLRFVASDLASGSIIEAAVDDIQVNNLSAVDGLGTRYCNPAVPNSTGSPGFMIVEGSTVVDDDNLILIATNLPVNSNTGYFIMGGGMNTFTPPGSAGPICVTPGLLRLLPPVSNTNEEPGGFSRAVGTSGPQTSNITAGSTWNFQAWHRDSMAGTSNLTDAVSIDFE